MGWVWSCFITAANVADVKAAAAVFVPVLETVKRVEKALADQGYRGQLGDQLSRQYGCHLEIGQWVGQGFEPQPWRWVVERTFAWLDNARRLARDYEELPESHESFVYLAMIRLILRRLGHNRRLRTSVTLL